MVNNLKTRILKFSLFEDSITIDVKGFNNKKVIGDFFILVKYAKKNLLKIIMDFQNYDSRTYPNILLPISGIISYYKDIEGLKFEFINLSKNYVKKTGFPKSFSVINHQKELEENIFDRIIEFKNTDEVNIIINIIFTQLTKMFSFPPGVLKGLNWGISEIMDNVINHAAANKALVMLQIHHKKNSLVCSVYDNGQGIYNSLKKSKKYEKQILNDISAIKLATKKGITRDSKIGAGYGLWGLSQIVKENNGTLGITSGTANLLLNEGIFIESTQSLKINEEFRSTLVELLIKYDVYIDMKKVFSDYSNNYDTYENIDIRIENMEDEYSYYVIFKLEEKTNLRTRTDGESVRNEIVNAHNVSGKPVKIDFTNVNNKITSSFIDESIAKLYTMYTIQEFSHKFKIIGADEFTQVLIKKTIEDRIAKSYANLLT